MVVDKLILLVPSLILGFGTGILVALFMHGEDLSQIKLVAKFVAGLLGVALEWLYFAIMEASTLQASLGKKVCGLRVTDMDGNRLSFARASGRFFGKYVSALTCLAGFIMAGTTQRKQALHDIMASTLVLKLL